MQEVARTERAFLLDLGDDAQAIRHSFENPIRIEEFPGRVARMHRLMTQRLALGIWRRLIIASPVDTGWSRMHWLLTYQQRDPRYPGQPPAEAGPNTYSAPQPNTQQPPLFPFVFIQNRVPYIERLNEGWSVQAPAMYVESAVDAEMAVLRSGNRRGPYVD